MSTVTHILDRLRLPLILGVVFIHCNLLQLLPEDAAGAEAFRWFMKAWDFILKLCVPTFFFISGYLYFRSGLLTRKVFADKLHRRVQTLMVPYLLWNAFALLTLLVKLSPPLAGFFPQYVGFLDSKLNLLTGFLALPGTMYPYDMPLWFLRNLIFINFLTPLISLVFRYCRAWGLLLFALLPMVEGVSEWGMAFSLWFFALGGAVSLYWPKMKALFRHPAMPIALYACIVAVYLIFDISDCLHLAYTVGVFFMLALATLFPRLDHIRWRNPSWVFFLYACHGLYCTLVTKFALSIFMPLSARWQPFAAYILAFLINCTATWCIYLCARRVAPHLTAILTGNRRKPAA